MVESPSLVTPSGVLISFRTTLRSAEDYWSITAI